jgi:phospholipid/cholesterol/gamma-HCH transport system permease protein
MISVTTRLALGYTSMLVHAFNHRQMLRSVAVRSALVRQIQLTGVQALPIIAIIAALFGAVVPTRALGLLGVSNEIVLKDIVWGGIRELGPLMTAVVIVARSSVAIAAETALMRLREKIPDAVWQEAAQEDEVVIPRVIGVAVSAAMLVAYFQSIAIVSALFAMALILGTPLESELDYFFTAVAWWQIPFSIGKGIVFGIGIATISCYHGLHAPLRVSGIPKAVVAACVGSLLFVLIADLFAALLLFI